MIKTFLHCRPAPIRQWSASYINHPRSRLPGIRHVSINTAISSGIRRSRPARESPRSRQFDDNSSHRTLRVDRQDRRSSKREPRPNHAGKQDFGDARESASRALESPNVRQRAYLRGGRPEDSDRPRSQASSRSSRGSFEGRSQGGDSHGASWSGKESADRRPSSFRSRQELDSPRSTKSRLPSETGSRSRSFQDGRNSTSSSADQLENMFTRDRKPRAAPSRFPARDRYESRESNRSEEGSSFRTPESRAPERRSSRFERQQSRYDDDSKTTSPKLKRYDDPVSIPYTTPASEFLYGTSVVTAALKASRRKLYKLYVYEGENRERTQQDNVMIRLARSVSVPVQSLSGDGIRMMDKMSAGRPHNVSLLAHTSNSASKILVGLYLGVLPLTTNTGHSSTCSTLTKRGLQL
jgi:21S rRNA (GM2251-2'-O)-methyltransferase